MSPIHVLVPLDGSPLADDALVHALEVFDCRITVLNVVTPIDADMIEGGVLEVDDARLESERDRADRLIERARNRAETVGRTIDTVVETGTPADEILAFVDRADIDHIVMGSHGGPTNSTLRRLLGTVATTVVSEAPVTVTVVKRS